MQGDNLGGDLRKHGKAWGSETRLESSNKGCPIEEVTTVTGTSLGRSWSRVDRCPHAALGEALSLWGFIFSNHREVGFPNLRAVTPGSVGGGFSVSWMQEH